MINSKSTKEPRLSLTSLKVLGLFASNPTEPLSGTDIRKTIGLATGTLYPILLRFEEFGWLKGEWESVDPSKVGRPRKRFYRLTGAGQRKASEVLAIFGRARPA